MPAGPRYTPLDGTDRVIVDGTNLLYRLGARTGRPAPAATVVGRMRGAIPVSIAIDLVFDGMGQGLYGRLAQNMLVRYSGKRSGDDTILDLVSEAAMHGQGGAAAADRVLVITERPPAPRPGDGEGRAGRAARVADLPPRPAAPGSRSRGGPVARQGLDDRVRPAEGPAAGQGRRGREPARLEARPRRDGEDGHRPQGRAPQAPPASPVAPPAHAPGGSRGSMRA